jgi:hypothetical protein
MNFTRALRYQFPLFRGEDVLTVQLRLRNLNIAAVGQPDGIFGAGTEKAVNEFKKSEGLPEDGIVGRQTWGILFPGSTKNSLDVIKDVLDEFKQAHQFNDSCTWQLTPKGVSIDGHEAEGTRGNPVTAAKIWKERGGAIQEWSSYFGVPVELIVATICTESRGNPFAERKEPGYRSDDETPNRVSFGLMQTLISTAREAVADSSIDRNWLLQPSNSIRAGTAYIAGQWELTRLDPPKVACAYNAGGIYHNDSPENRWKMRQFPIGSSHHADRFVEWFNDCFRFFEDGPNAAPELSFYALMHA